MSTAQIYLIHDNSSAANFRAWGEGISLQMTTCGWTKTSDSGQVDWTTTPAVPAANSYVYEIRRPTSDPLQTGATAYYIKLEYGNNTSGATFPEVRVSLGTGTNGSGTLTGFVAGPFALRGGGTGPAGSGSVAWECNFSWSTSRMGVMLWRNAWTTHSGIPCFFGIERTKANDGTDSAEGVFLVTLGGIVNSWGGFSMRGIIFGAGVTNNYTSNGANGVVIPALDSGYINNAIGTSDVLNSNIPISPLFPVYGKFGNPLTIMGTGRKVDLGEGILLTTTLYGATRTYMVAKTGTGNGYFAGIGMGNANCMMMRFD